MMHHMMSHSLLDVTLVAVYGMVLTMLQLVLSCKLDATDHDKAFLFSDTQSGCQCLAQPLILWLSDLLQVTSSFKTLTQAQPDLTMTFVSEVAKKMGLPHSQSEGAVIDTEEEQTEYVQDGMPDHAADSPESSSQMDVDSNRRRR